MADAAEAFTPLTPGLVGGRRRSVKKLKLVKKKTVRRMLKKMGMKMRGGAPELAGPGKVAMDAPAADAAVKAAAAPAGGRRHKSHKKSHRRKSLFGMRF